MAKGDLFWVTYSGHGGQVPDTNGDEDDRMDETWVLYDRQLVDDELHLLYSKFKSGVRILVVSDSCHSGTVTRATPPWEAAQPAVRAMPGAVGVATYRANKKLYDGIQKANVGSESAVVKASVLLISGCQDNQVSLDGSRNGLFTETMKKVWNNGKFKFGYKRFRDTIVATRSSRKCHRRRVRTTLSLVAPTQRSRVSCRLQCSAGSCGVTLRAVRIEVLCAARR